VGREVRVVAAPDLIERVWILGALDVFARLTSEQLSRIALVARGEQHAAGALIYMAGAAPTAMFVVRRGRVCLEREGERVATVRAGGDFGTSALFDPEPRGTAARAESDAMVLRIDRRAFDELIDEYPDVARGIFRSLAQHVRVVAGATGPGAAAPRREPWL
jgi:CBS domain-containing protein